MNHITNLNQVLEFKCFFCNCSVGLRIYCADREKRSGNRHKFIFVDAKQSIRCFNESIFETEFVLLFLHGFVLVTMRVLNSYILFINLLYFIGILVSHLSKIENLDLE